MVLRESDRGFGNVACRVAGVFSPDSRFMNDPFSLLARHAVPRQPAEPRGRERGNRIQHQFGGQTINVNGGRYFNPRPAP
jgi:hypothetical protein